MTRAFIIGAAVLLSTQAALAGAPSFVSDGAISICTTAAFPPLSYKKDPGDTVPVGIDIEIAEALAKIWAPKRPMSSLISPACCQRWGQAVAA